MTKTKNLKIQYASRCTSIGYQSHYSYYPKIQIQGKWLENLGFHIGDNVKIEYEEGCIRITPAAQSLSMVAENESEYCTK